MIPRAARVVALAASLAACGGTAASSAPPTSSASASRPTWERPGLGGAVRPEMGSPQPGEAAPDFTLPTADRKTVTLSSMRGSWVVLHFTATWCPFCDSEVEHLGKLADAYASRGVRTVIVDVEEKESVWNAYAVAHVAPSVVALHDASGAASARFAPPRAQPSFEDRAQAVLDGTLIIDPQGKIRLFLLPDSAHFDPTFRAVRAEIERLVPEPVVAISAGPSLAVAAGGRGEVALTLRVAPGYHVMSDRPSAPTYVPTNVELDATPGVNVGTALYPASVPLALADKMIATFAGSLEVRVPIEIAKDAPVGVRHLRGAVRYQACTSSRCLFPTTRAFDVTLLVTAPP